MISLYKKESATEFSFGDTHTLFTSVCMFVSYDYEDKVMPGTMIKHGTHAQILMYKDKTAKQYSAMESHPEFSSVRFFIVDVSHIPIKEINQCIESTGYIGTLLKKYDLIPPRYDEYSVIE